MAIELKEGNGIILFGDLNGYVRLCQNENPFKVAEFLHDFYAACARSIEDEGGRIDRFMGDAVLATFDIPEIKEGSGRHAVAAARQFIKLASSLEDMKKYGITLGCGLHSGPVIYGELGVGISKTFTVLGETVNIAAHLCYKANRELNDSGIMISHSMAQVLAKGAVEAAGAMKTGKETIEIYKII